MSRDGERARSKLLYKLKNDQHINITMQAYNDARDDFGLTKDGILAIAIKELEDGIKIKKVDQDTGSTGWVIKPEIYDMKAYFKFCIEGSQELLTIVSAHKSRH